jgi:hypothetical protein
MAASSYVIAGVDTFVQLFSKFLDASNDEFLSNPLFASFLADTVNKYLFSYGTGINYKTKKLSKKHDQRFLKVVNKVRSSEFMKDTKLFWDSGGFQVAQGGVRTEDMPKFMDNYCNMICEHNDKFEQAFILDLPPGPGSTEIFDSYKQIEDINRISYNKFRTDIPDDIRKKIIYIHHFRTPSLYKTWNKFLFDENLGEGYEYFGTGGIVANLASDVLIPIIIYTIPLSTVLSYVKQRGIKKFKFHVLGGANYVDIFYHQLFTYHIKQIHDIEVEITYDSSAIFKALAIGRYINVVNADKKLVKMDIRSANLPMRLTFGDGTVEDTVFKLVNKIAVKYGFKPLDKINNPIYNLETGTLGKENHMYLMCYVLNIFKTIEEVSKQFVERIYPIYAASNKTELVPDSSITEFDTICQEFTQKINQGKRTKKQFNKTSSIFKSLQILEKLDLDINEHYVKKYLSGDDVSTWGGGGSILWE